LTSTMRPVMVGISALSGRTIPPRVFCRLSSLRINSRLPRGSTDSFKFGLAVHAVPEKAWRTSLTSTQNYYTPLSQPTEMGNSAGHHTHLTSRAAGVSRLAGAQVSEITMCDLRRHKRIAVPRDI